MPNFVGLGAPHVHRHVALDVILDLRPASPDPSSMQISFSGWPLEIKDGVYDTSVSCSGRICPIGSIVLEKVGRLRPVILPVQEVQVEVQVLVLLGVDPVDLLLG